MELKYVIEIARSTSFSGEGDGDCLLMLIDEIDDWVVQIWSAVYSCKIDEL